MKIFISGEIQSGVYDLYRIAARKIEQAFSEHFGDKAFGSSLVDLTYIAIIRNIESGTFNEVKKYRKKEHSVEFRLKIPFAACLLADTAEMTRLVAASLHRAIALLKDMKIPDFDCDAFESEFLKLARRENWLN
ncbi:Imm44 family immunity protein [Massilia sp. TWR1-2-2]|uniref:Imm44 family immunity protein n=1 Tax=Massilia sp. TWR1-2-2 TaxID=2804584 RepID=UPI003CF1F6FC